VEEMDGTMRVVERAELMLLITAKRQAYEAQKAELQSPVLV
jgi:hypothetical protein